MPTGYTLDIYDGKSVSFENFAMNCARAFGYLIEMRDEPLNAPIKVMVPSDYHSQQLKKLQEMIEKFESLSLDGANKKAQKEYELAMKEHNKTTQSYRKLHGRYSKMLEKVMDWEPPSRCHETLKDFMISQLEDSMEGDCNLKSHERYKPKLIEGSKWKKIHIENCERDIKYHTEQFEKEKANCQKINEWVSKLRESVKGK